MILHLKEIMGMKGVSSIALSEKIGVSKATVSYWINGRVFPDPDKLQAIADALGVKVWELFKDPQETEEETNITGACPHCGRSIKLNIEINKD